MRRLAITLLLLAVRAFPQDRELHFSGEVSLGQEFRHDIGSDLTFLLAPTDAGWNIRVRSKAPCGNQNDDWALVNPPFRGRNMKYLEPSHGVTAQEAVNGTYEVRFLRTCTDFKLEAARLEIVLWPYTHSQRETDEALAKLGSSPMGIAKLTILKSKVSPTGHPVEGKDYGKIDWLSFRVDITPLAAR